MLKTVLGKWASDSYETPDPSFYRIDQRDSASAAHKMSSAMSSRVVYCSGPTEGGDAPLRIGAVLKWGPTRATANVREALPPPATDNAAHTLFAIELLKPPALGTSHSAELLASTFRVVGQWSHRCVCRSGGLPPAQATACSPWGRGREGDCSPTPFAECSDYQKGCDTEIRPRCRGAGGRRGVVLMYQGCAMSCARVHPFGSPQWTFVAEGSEANHVEVDAMP